VTRRGLVLGAGGVLGFAWAVGALAALEKQEGFDCRDVDMIIGTSAGSVTAALLGCGVPVEAMVRYQSGMPAPGDPVIDYDDETDGTGPLPPRPAFALGSPSLLANTVRHPLTVTPLAALSSVLPRGRGSLASIAGVVSSIQASSGAESAWASHPSTWVVAMDYDSGKRVAFGRDGSPVASLSDAVTASCAIPGWYAPIEIGGHRYVDGGACSSTSLDLLAGAGLDEVFVVAPMVSFAYDTPSGVAVKLERRVRRAITRRLLREAEKVQAAGTRVTLLGPGAEDLETIGANLMDASRRDAVFTTSLRTSMEALRRSADPYELNDDGSTVAS
jgi:NTE family protein